MTLVAMAVYDTKENKRSWMTQATLQGLLETVPDWDYSTNRLFVIDNNSCEETQSIYREWGFAFLHRGERPAVFDNRNWFVIPLKENVGTAKAINLAWRLREPGEVCVKMDNDVAIRDIGWLDLMEDVFRRMPDAGIVGLKRKDCEERPDHPNQEWFGSRLIMTPKQGGERWIVVEEVNHVMGTCQAYRPELLDVMGYLYQLGGLYGFDDSLAAVRAWAAGYKSYFIPQVEIDHIDPGTTPYQKWKEAYAGERMTEFNNEKARIRATYDVRYDGEFETYEHLWRER
jgi:GT2 family glycosyltransferase